MVRWKGRASSSVLLILCISFALGVLGCGAGESSPTTTEMPTVTGLQTTPVVTTPTVTPIPESTPAQTATLPSSPTPTPTPTPTPSLLDYETYSNYGFSFKYPRTHTLSVIGLLENEANERSGLVSVAWEKYRDYDGFQVTWLQTILFDLNVSVESGLQGMSSVEGTLSMEKGELVRTSKSGHDMLYRNYTITQISGDCAYGVAGAVYCDKSQTLFNLLTLSTMVVVEKDIIDNFMTYLDSFVCH